MSEEKKLALVLHLATGNQSLSFPIRSEDRDELERDLPLLLDHGSVQSVRTADGVTVSVNFAHVGVAYIDDLHREGAPFGLR